MNPGTKNPGQVPIACTLTASELPSRVDEWKEFVRTCVVETRRVPGSVSLLLVPTEEALVAAVSLAQREKECCAFFAFSITIEHDARWLCVTVPEGAEVTMDSFAKMLTVT